MNEKCFALRKGCACSALAVKNCVGYQCCPFYRPVWQWQKRLSKADMRLRKLPLARQTDISEKYYHGETPWREEPI
ncbi:MAG: hypothetical protein RSJ41_08955 [Clostridia bacterium]